MRCKQVRKRFPLFLYDELDEPGRREIENHLNGCAACSEYLAELTSLTRRVSAPATVSEPDWEGIWWRIDHTLAVEKPTPSRRPFPGWRWAVAASFLAIAFVLGIGVGHVFFFRLGPSPQPDTRACPLDLTTVLAEHVGSLRPLLIEYSHAGAALQPLAVDSALIYRLLVDNRLLRRSMQKGGDPVMQELLDDIDLILTEITHADPQDRDSLSQIGGLIRRKGIPFRINVLKIEDHWKKRL